MNIFLIILGAICLLAGIVGCIVPALPGLPLAYLGLLIVEATEKVDFSWQFLALWAVVVVIVSLLDNFIPIWGTKQFGGTKWGVWGSTAGLLVGFLMGPWGIIIGPLVGAFIGEVLFTRTDGNIDIRKAARSAFGSLLGLMTGVVLKLVCCALMVYYFIEALI